MWAGYGSCDLSPHSLNPYCSFASARVFMLLFVWMISWSQLALNMLARELKPFCTLFEILVGLCLAAIGMPLSLLAEKFTEVQQLCYWGNPLLYVRFVLFGQHHLLCQWTCTTLPVVLCHSEWNVYHSPVQLFLLFSSLHQLHRLSYLQQSLISLQFLLADVIITTNATHHHWALLFSGFLGSSFLLWHLVWFFVQGAYSPARTPGGCTLTVWNGLSIVWWGGCLVFA